MKKPRTLRAGLALIVAASSLSACETSYDEAVERWRNGSSTTPSATPPPSTPPPSTPPPSASFGPVFSEIQAGLFTPTCATSTCHAGGSPAAGLALDAAGSYAQLVGITSSQQAALQRVEPGDPANSYLIQKLEGTAATGTVMPPGGAIAQPDIDVIRQWITDGAIDDRVPVSNPIRVSSLSPVPGVTLTSAPASILAGFDRPLDASTVNAMTFILEGSGGDANFANGNEVQIAAASIDVPGANPQSAVFDLTGVVLGDDTYRVRLMGVGGSVILDLDANVLDGEFSGSLPSGNGAAGGNFMATFTIATPVVLGPTLDQIQAAVFTPTCAGCHTGPAGPGLPAGLDLSDTDASFAALVGIASEQEAAILRVAANDPDNSYLIQKLEGSAATGVQMPLGGALAPAVIAEIRQWIADGALR